MINVNSATFWDEQYKNSKDVWNLNNSVPVFVQLLEEEKFLHPSKLLIPGSGKGYELIDAAKRGYDVTGIDFSAEANNFAKNLASEEGLKIEVLNEDLFELGKNHSEEFDYIFEYVTICAVLPDRRMDLLRNINSALKQGGKFISLLFPIDKRDGGPPFSIDMFDFFKMAKEVFSPVYFSRKINSIKPRRNNEVLFIFKKGENG
ncbi:MAG: SAM-dependent methyltransferase [Melioribacteraceae bacterium]|nr:MAG: SAM-dependent methyltransferase [Melioribacteraceae bacterium]